MHSSAGTETSVSRAFVLSATVSLSSRRLLELATAVAGQRPRGGAALHLLRLPSPVTQPLSMSSQRRCQESQGQARARHWRTQGSEKGGG
ncbi:hypothetical protein GQ55_9G312600 [Panicum hallii var. hallii]|uniref:Uncharacterized protein n=1 Tax=Panicum hallii var. hallii TaxID=1504633 RepID=A0A2T7C7Z4_9POAL|nr:hypothetical protein GQ55_9G312600 [Panicum hallii var. hallii]